MVDNVGGEMITLKKARERVIELKSNFRRALNIGDTASLICNYKDFKHWTDEDFDNVIDRLIKYDNYPENLLNTMEDIHKQTQKKVNFLRDCYRCNNTGYRYYKTIVRNGGFDFKNKRVTEKERICVAACGCDHGKLRVEREGIPWYNDVINREGVQPAEDNPKERKSQILEPLEEKYEELPFVL